MSFEVTTAIDKSRTLHTDIQSERFTDPLPLDYYPAKVGDVQKFLQEQQAIVKVDRYEENVAAFLLIVAAWPVVKEGAPVPLTTEGLASVKEWFDGPLLGTIITAIINEAVVGETSGTRLRKRS